MGIAASRAVNYKCDAVGTALNFSVLNKAVVPLPAGDKYDIIESDGCGHGGYLNNPHFNHFHLEKGQKYAIIWLER